MMMVMMMMMTMVFIVTSLGFEVWETSPWSSAELQKGRGGRR